MAKRSKRSAQGAGDDGAMSPKMRQLILSFDAKRPAKQPRARDARGRFVSTRQRAPATVQLAADEASRLTFHG